MIHIFNRKELAITFDLNVLQKMKDTLANNHIKYITRSSSLNQLGRSHGIPGIRYEFTFEYKIYVHRKDFEKAKFLLG